MKRLVIIVCVLLCTPHIFVHKIYTQNHYPIRGTIKLGKRARYATTESIMQQSDTHDQNKSYRSLKKHLVDQARKNKNNNRYAPDIAQFPRVDMTKGEQVSPYAQGATEDRQDDKMGHDDTISLDDNMQDGVDHAPQAVGINFLGAQFSDSFEFPPDSMGTVGPTQFMVVINGRVRTFNKSNGSADGALNVSLDTFFNPIRNGQFTTDPRIRYDRFSQRWFVICVTDPASFNNNRVMIAVSNTSTITSSTVWTYFFFNVGSGIFLDYPTLGIDNQALYIGGVTFASSGNFNKVYVVRKSSILGSGPIVFTTFDDVIDESTGVGPYAPQGVDNFDPGATEGYFIGVNNAEFGSLVIRRIANPGGIPTMSDNQVITVPSTQIPILVPHLGNNNGNQGKLDSIDDRLFMAHVRNGHLWTAHNIGVNNVGVSNNRNTLTRNGSRWYQIDVSNASPTLMQVGTLFQATPTNTTNQVSYWMPSIMTSGQQHMALGCSVAGSQSHIDCATAGRLASDALGKTEAPVRYTSASTAYNPPDDPGSNRGRRWGDYSYTSVDPCDDMTMWTIQEYCNATNSWGVRVAKLKAPPPATPSSASPSIVPHGLASTNVTITGSSNAGSGFFNPGAGFACHIKALVSGGVKVKHVTYTDPTHVTLTISTVGATIGRKNVTITNPDGQKKKGVNLLTVV